MRKLLALILALILSVSVASCGCSKKDDDKKPANDTQKEEVKNEEKDNKEEKDVPKNKVIEAKETSDTKEKTEEIYENHKGKEANPINMHNLFKLLNIVDIKDTAMKVSVNGPELLYRIINNEKYFDVSPVAYAKVSAAIFAIYPEIKSVRYEMEYQGNDYNIYYFDSIKDVATTLNSNYYNEQTLAKARESEAALKNYLGEIDKIKVPEASLEDAVNKCFAYNEWSDYGYKQYDPKVKKYSFVLPQNADLPLNVENLYFENDADIYEGFYGKPVELLQLNIKQSNIEKPVNYFFLFDKDQIIWFGNVDGYEDLALATIRYGLTDEMMELYKARNKELNQ